MPVLVPALGERYLREWLASFDGLLFTGSPSNVEPHRYLGPKSAPGTLHDPERDATTLPMINGALDAGLPILGICRGFQEINVALGGSLTQKLQEHPGQPRPPRGQGPAARGAVRARARDRRWWRAACCTRSRAHDR